MISLAWPRAAKALARARAAAVLPLAVGPAIAMQGREDAAADTAGVGEGDGEGCKQVTTQAGARTKAQIFAQATRPPAPAGASSPTRPAPGARPNPRAAGPATGRWQRPAASS